MSDRILHPTDTAVKALDRQRTEKVGVGKERVSVRRKRSFGVERGDELMCDMYKAQHICQLSTGKDWGIRSQSSQQRKIRDQEPHHKPVKVMDALICGICHRNLPGMVILTQWDLRETHLEPQVHSVPVSGMCNLSIIVMVALAR